MEKDGCFTATPQLPLKERARKVLRLRDDSSRTDHLALKRGESMLRPLYIDPATNTFSYLRPAIRLSFVRPMGIVTLSSRKPETVCM